MTATNRIKPEKSICSYHDEIKSIVCDIAKLASKGECDIGFEEILCKTEEILSLVDFATMCGQGMEDRLFEYRQTIESLGFKRVKDE